MRQHHADERITGTRENRAHVVSRITATVIKARDVAKVPGSQPLTLGTAVAGPWNFTV